MKSMRWKQVTLSIPNSFQDLLVGQLVALGFHGMLQEEGELIAFIRADQWNRKLESGLRYCIKQFEAEFPQLRIRVGLSSVRQQNWNRQWERSIGIIEPAPGILVKPSWQRLRKKDRGKIVLHIDPKMSFGTGHHETTRLCLRLLHDYVRPNMSVLDFGSGTGILAIAAIKLGARGAVAVDHDEWTIPNIKENLKRNRVSKKIKVVLGDISSIGRGRFDLIVANVDLPTISNVLPQFFRRLHNGGLLILSGLLTTDLLALHQHIGSSGLAPLEVVEDNEWSAITLVRT
jgi:ribosomal protein L11 methyltransferase